MKEEAPPKDIIMRILEAATWAPNHHMTEPWRFVVFEGDERKKLGDALSKALEPTIKNDDQKREELLRQEKEKPLSAPVIIAMIFCPKQGGKIIPQEEIVSAGASLQNALLAAHSLGLSTFVRTGAHAYSEPVKNYLGIKENESLLAFVYLGYRAEEPRPTSRTSVEARIEWRGSLL
jgi:nitroreductase